MPSYSPGKARTSQRTTTATEVRAGATTFMVMAYIIFVNPLILGFGGVPGLEGKGLPFAPTLTVTCLSAGLLSIAMGVFAKYPLALAPGMGLNAVVAFELVAEPRAHVAAGDDRRAVRGPGHHDPGPHALSRSDDDGGGRLGHARDRAG